jgi:hypothetical protein
VLQVVYLRELTDFLFINSWHWILLRNRQLILFIKSYHWILQQRDNYFVTASNWIISWGSYIIPSTHFAYWKLSTHQGLNLEGGIFTSPRMSPTRGRHFVLSNLNPNIECCQTNAGEDYIYFKDSECFYTLTKKGQTVLLPSDGNVQHTWAKCEEIKKFNEGTKYH